MTQHNIMACILVFLCGGCGVSLPFLPHCRIFSMCMLFIEAPFLAFFSPKLEFIVKYTSYIKSWMRMLIYFG